LIAQFQRGIRERIGDIKLGQGRSDGANECSGSPSSRMIKPPIKALSPVPTFSRVEIWIVSFASMKPTAGKSAGATGIRGEKLR
jgi:hypothetical protein